MNHGSVIAKYSAIPGHHTDRCTIDHSLRRNANAHTISNARNGATGPFARVATLVKKLISNSQNFELVSYHAYQPSNPLDSGAAICMSVAAPRENPMIPAHATVISAASKWPPRRN